MYFTNFIVGAIATSTLIGYQYLKPLQHTSTNIKQIKGVVDFSMNKVTLHAMGIELTKDNYFDSMSKAFSLPSNSHIVDITKITGYFRAEFYQDILEYTSVTASEATSIIEESVNKVIYKLVSRFIEKPDYLENIKYVANIANAAKAFKEICQESITQLPKEAATSEFELIDMSLSSIAATSFIMSGIDYFTTNHTIIDNYI